MPRSAASPVGLAVTQRLPGDQVPEVLVAAFTLEPTGHAPSNQKRLDNHVQITNALCVHLRSGARRAFVPYPLWPRWINSAFFNRPPGCSGERPSPRD